jgi:hypothetical protein
MLDQMLGRMLSEMELDDFKRRMDDTQADGMVRLAQRRHDFDMHSDRMLKVSPRQIAASDCDWRFVYGLPFYASVISPDFIRQAKVRLTQNELKTSTKIVGNMAAVTLCAYIFVAINNKNDYRILSFQLSIAAFQNPRQFNEVVGRVYNREIAVGDECGAPTTDVFGQQEDDEVEQMLAQFDECQMERVATVHKAIRNLTAKLKCPVARLYYVQVQLKRAPVKKVVENGERKEARELVVAEEESQADGLEAGRREEEADGGEGARGRNVNEEEASNTYEFFINGVTKNIIANKFSLKFVVQQC